jgi:hypothetical protein
MCDPVSLTIASTVGAVASAGGSLYEGQQAAAGLQATQDAQNQANASWVAYQNKIHQDQVAAEDLQRQKATGAQQDTLGKVSAPAQEAAQGAEAERLNTLYTKPGSGSGGAQDPSNPSNLLLTGEGTGNQNFMDSLTTQVNQATAQARGRIQALATANSYGGSFGGLGTTVPITFAQGGNDINLANSIRQGNLKTYGVQQQVQPIQYGIGPGTTAAQGLSKSLGSLAGTLAGSAGPKVLGAAGNLAGGLAGGASAGVGSGFDFSNFNPDVTGIFNNLPANAFDQV